MAGSALRVARQTCDAKRMSESTPNGMEMHARTAEILLRTGATLGMHHAELATYLGVSRRSVSRWGKQGTLLSEDNIAALATLARSRNEPELAAEIAALGGQSLVSLGLAVAPPSPKMVDAVVCAAAEALDVSPRGMRRALLAGVRCAREVGMTLEALEAALAGSEKR